jgi:hypothetical protein
MANNDSRTHYFRFSKVGFQALKVPEAFLIARKLVKTEATDESERTYYTAEDGLTFEQAMLIYNPSSVALMDESAGGAPVNLGSLADNEVIPEEMTHAYFGLHDLSIKELASAIRQADAIGEDVSLIVIPWGHTHTTYLSTGELPS